MKKMLIILSSVVLLFSLLIVPASAADYQLTGTFNEGGFGAEGVPMPLNGPAVLTLYDNGNSYSFDFVLGSEACSVSDDGVPELGISTIEICIDENNFFIISCYDDNYDPALVYCAFTLDYQVADVPPVGNESVGVLDVFSAVGQWFVAQLGAVVALFVTVSDGVYHLTFFGIMTLVGIGLAVILLIIRAVGSFLSMRR